MAPSTPKLNDSKAADSTKSKLDARAINMQEDWTVDAAEELETFRKALLDDSDDIDGVEKLTAVSDFAPIHQKVNKGHRGDVIREGWTYHASRWPLLLLVFSMIALEFAWYCLVRQFVNVLEYFSWRGARGGLKLALRTASTYKEWKKIALKLDSHLGYSAWKRTPTNAYYDHALIKRVLRSLKGFREEEDYEGVSTVLEVALRSNFAGIESYHLYSESFYGTKDLVENYLDEVVASLKFIREAPTAIISDDEKSKLFRSFAKNLGTSALCLSGGAAFAYYHFGVLKALLQANVLPRIMTGTSAGALVAAFACTRTDKELQVMLTPELASRITACEESIRVWGLRAYRTGARFDTLEWAKKAMFFTMGSMTFLEAFQRTGRVLNISVIPYDTYSPLKLLNYINSPNCVIYSAVIASAAVPGILNPVLLLKKDANGKITPMDFQGRLKDGSLRADIPLESLHSLYNTNFSIVSQVNPHIHLFHFASRGAPGRPVIHRKGKGWRGGYILASLEKYLKLELTKNFKVIRDLELMPEFGGQDWSAVFLQRFDGTVTIWPRSRIMDWFRILSDPDEKEMERILKVGQKATWPKLHMIGNRLKIEREIEAGREAAYQALVKAGSPASALLRRESSYDLAARIPSATTSLDSTSINSTDSDEEGSLNLETGESGRTTPTPRRRKILARLGLKSSSSFSSRVDLEAIRARSQSVPNLIRRLSIGARSRRDPVEDLGFADSDSSVDIGEAWSSELEDRVLL